MPSFSLRRLGRWSALVLLPAALLFSSCTSSRYYNQRTLFRLTDAQGHQLDSSKLRIAVNRTERNYVIHPNDILTVQVNTNKGEKILDPNGELKFGGGASGGAAAQTVGATRGAAQGGGSTGGISFEVQADGTVVLPMINRVRVAGLSLLQADSVLRTRYDEYYRDAFVVTRVTNNRVIVLGAPGGQVISLTNDNMNLLEVLALAGGIDGSSGGGGLYRYGGKANNIRIIRGNLKNPRIQQVDLSTLDGMRRANLQMEPNDIVYVEPVRRPVQEALTDVAPLLSFASLVLTTTFFLISFVKR